MNCKPANAHAAVTTLALALAALAGAFGIYFGTFTASGADSYGYVSQADLWIKGTLIIDQPLHDEFSWRWANWTLAPLGYRPGEVGGTMVPVYGPGLPLLMAAFKLIGGENALYLVVPLLGALTVWLTYRLGLRFGDQYVAALATIALLVSPIFLSRLVWPMSDVPVTAWWLAAIVLAFGPSTGRAALAGAAAAVAILTRPNLFPLAAPVAMLVVMVNGFTRAGVIRAIAFIAAMLPGAIAVAVFNNHLYGSPLVSGYGTIDTIYASRHFFTNLVQYPKWLVQTQTPFIMLAIAAPFLVRRAGHAGARRLSTFALTFFGSVLLLYLWSTPYDDREFLRFLLPGYPLILAAAAAAFGVLVPTARGPRTAAFGVLALVLAVWGIWQGGGAFVMRDAEARYRSAAQFAAALPENAVFLCNQHSGSLRYYANRLTLRFEWLAPDVYADALQQVRQSGRPLFVVLDDWERDIFRARYAGVADLSWLDEAPILVAAKRVYFYQLSPASSP